MPRQIGLIINSRKSSVHPPGVDSHVEIVLIRHAQPERWQGEGPADPRLTPEGVAQAQRLVGYLASNGAPTFHSVYSSTMTRAVQTAQALATRLGLHLHTDADLVEYDHHLNFYLPTEEIEEDFETYWANLQQGNYVGHHIDLGALQQRVVGAVDRIIAAHNDGERVAVICHGGVISAYLSSIMGHSKPLFFEPEYTSISRVRIYPSGRRYVMSANETPHMGFHGWHSTLV